jgi:hypothetical protein
MKRPKRSARSTPPSTIEAKAAVESTQSVASIESPHTAHVPAIVAGAFDRLNLRQRARMLGRLLASVGPLALTVVGGGAFAKYVAMARWPEVPVSLEDAGQATAGQVYELVRYVQQSNPQVLNQLMNLLARDTVTIAALGASVAALTISSLASSRK